MSRNKHANSRSQTGCFNCTEALWNTPAGEFTCGERIQSLIRDQKETEESACRKVAENYPGEYGSFLQPSKYVIVAEN